MRNQCKLLGIARSTLDYTPVAESAEDLAIKRKLDEIYLIDPCLGTRRLVTVLERDHGIHVNRKRLQRLRQQMGIEAIYCRPRTSEPGKGHRIYPYLLRDLVVQRPNQVWCTDITYIPMKRGFAYLCAVMDWHSRRVLSWTLSNTLDTAFCIEALNLAVSREGRAPEIFNTDQGCQFTSAEWTGRLTELGVKISMDGKGRYLDNIFIERLWRSLKHEDIYLHEYATIPELRAGIQRWMKHYNGYRPHQALGNRTPDAAHRGEIEQATQQPTKKAKKAA
jgi:putative transposase